MKLVQSESSSDVCAGAGSSAGGKDATGGNSDGGSKAGSSTTTGGSGPDAGSAGTGSGGTGALDTGGEPSAGGSPVTCTDGDCCPEDADKTEPGACGCGTPDVDADEDGTFDCDDACPNDAGKVALGACGCGIPETDTAQLASCSTLEASLIHRYDFEGGGKVVKDRVGTSDGTVEGSAEQSQLEGKGVLQIAGGAYVNLPNGLVSKLTAVSLEFWVGWNGGKSWQRVFDFGASTAVPPEYMVSYGKSYLFFTPLSSYGSARFGYSLNGSANETAISLGETLAASSNHVVCVIDTVADKMLLYFNGKKTGEATTSNALSAVNDVNVWLGRSQYQADTAFSGTYHEFRMYDKALSAKEVAASHAGGPDPLFLAY